MSAIPLTPRRLFGVSFPDSRPAGSTIWIARVHPGLDGVRVESVDTVRDLPGGPDAAEAVMRWLVGKVVEAPRSAWGIGSPFGLAAGSDDDWLTCVRRAAEAWPPPGASDERRRTDAELDLDPPLAPARAEAAQLVIGGLLAPTLAQPGIVVLPQQPVPMVTEGMPPEMAARVASIYLVETAPRALARRLIPDHDAPGASGREDALRELVRLRHVRPLARRLRTRIAAQSGALDALLCAVAAGNAMRRSDHGSLHAEPAYRNEGYVYC